MNKLAIAVIVSLVALSLADFQPKTQEDALKAHAHCRSEAKVSDEEYELLSQYKVPANFDPHNCYMKCFITQLGLYSDASGLNAEAVVAQLTRVDPDDVKSVTETLQKCVKGMVPTEDACLTLNQAVGCWLQSNREVVLKVFGA